MQNSNIKGLNKAATQCILILITVSFSHFVVFFISISYCFINVYIVSY